MSINVSFPDSYNLGAMCKSCGRAMLVMSYSPKLFDPFRPWDIGCAYSIRGGLCTASRTITKGLAWKLIQSEFDKDEVLRVLEYLSIDKSFERSEIELDRSKLPWEPGDDIGPSNPYGSREPSK